MTLLRRGLALAFPVASGIRGLYRRIMRPITVGVRAIILDGDQVLLIRQHGSGYWVFPGGGVKRGESLRTAAVREAIEETGCAVVADRLLGMYTGVHQGMTNHVAAFVCGATGQPSQRLNIEIAEARYWPLDQLPPNVAAIVPRWLAQYQRGEWGADRQL